MNTLAILITAYAPVGGNIRCNAAVQAVESWKKHLAFDGSLHVHVADDGTPPEMEEVYGRIFWEQLIGDWATFSYSRQERQGVGASFNRGFQICHSTTPYVLYAVDDWELTGDLDVTPWVDILREEESVGCIRLGAVNPFMRGGELKRFKNGRYGIIWERYSYYWSQRPAVYHSRFLKAYGPFPEEVDALVVDRIYNERICESSGPDVVLAVLEPWRHLPSIELGDIDPKEDEHE